MSGEKLVERGEEAWLLAQLKAWPTRVDPTKTTNIEFLMQSSADLIEQLQARLAEAEVAMRPFAEAARNYLVALGPDGIDDGLTITAVVNCRPEREAQLSTSDFRAAASWLAGR